MSIATSLDKLSETLTNCKTNLKEKGVEADSIKISDVDEKIAEIKSGGTNTNVVIHYTFSLGTYGEQDDYMSAPTCTLKSLDQQKEYRGESSLEWSEWSDEYEANVSCSFTIPKEEMAEKGTILRLYSDSVPKNTYFEVKNNGFYISYTTVIQNYDTGEQVGYLNLNESTSYKLNGDTSTTYGFIINNTNRNYEEIKGGTKISLSSSGYYTLLLTTKPNIAYRKASVSTIPDMG